MSYLSYVIIKLILSTLPVSSTVVTSYHNCHLSKFVTINSKAITAVSIRLISSRQIMVISVTSSTIMSSTKHQVFINHLNTFHHAIGLYIESVVLVTIWTLYLVVYASPCLASYQHNHHKQLVHSKTLTVWVLSLYHKYCIRNASCTTVCITILQYLSLQTMHYFIRHHATVCATRVSSLVHHSHYSIICHHQTRQCKHQRFIIIYCILIFLYLLLLGLSSSYSSIHYHNLPLYV